MTNKQDLTGTPRVRSDSPPGGARLRHRWRVCLFLKAWDQNGRSHRHMRRAGWLPSLRALSIPWKLDRVVAVVKCRVVRASTLAVNLLTPYRVTFKSSPVAHSRSRHAAFMSSPAKTESSMLGIWGLSASGVIQPSGFAAVGWSIPVHEDCRLRTHRRHFHIGGYARSVLYVNASTYL
jgi:hypothetical protein